MCLNKKIRKGMNETTKDISIFDNQGLYSMIQEMKHEELDLITFCALADIYDVEYSFTLILKSTNMTRTRIIKSIDNCTLWDEIDELYYEYTNKILDSGCMTYRELVETFDKINGEIIFE
jgi:hypothetical protein